MVRRDRRETRSFCSRRFGESPLARGLRLSWRPVVSTAKELQVRLRPPKNHVRVLHLIRSAILVCQPKRLQSGSVGKGRTVCGCVGNHT
jgi:hypothetical protein